MILKCIGVLDLESQYDSMNFNTYHGNFRADVYADACSSLM
jgi:hypothetical protein